MAMTRVLVLVALMTAVVGVVRGQEPAELQKIQPIKSQEAFSEVKPSVKTIQDRYQNVKNHDVNLARVVQVGEKLEYQVRWKGIPAGTITLNAKRTKRVGDRQAFTFEMDVESNDFLSFIYPVNSTITSLADVDSGTSYLFRRDLQEGRRRVNDRLQFDYSHVTADGRNEPVSIYSKVKDGETQTSTPRPIPGPLQDSLSVVYYLRHLQFDEPGDSHELLIGGRKRVDLVTITAKSFERYESPLGTFECIVVEPIGDEEADRTNIVATEGSANIWLERHTGIPLHLTVKVPFGMATATLVKARNAGLEGFAVQE